VLTAAGLSEAVTFGFIEREAARAFVADGEAAALVGVANPLSAKFDTLRPSLLPGLVDALAYNRRHGRRDVALFEIARVYLPSGEQLPDERWRLGSVVGGGYAAAKGVLEALYAALQLELRVTRGSHALLHPGKAARTDAGWLGELHPTLLDGVWGAFELDLETLFGAVAERVVYEDVITFPAVLQDIAVAVDEDVEVGALVYAAGDAAGPMLREARVFDVYRGEQVGEGRKSVAIHLAFQSPERTLTDDEAAELRGRIVAALTERFGADLRA